jgi:LysM repeat protein
MAIGLAGLTACSRQAQQREEEAAGQPSAAVAEATPGMESVAPLPGETVVSAVSPTPAPAGVVTGSESVSSEGQSATAELVIPTEQVAEPVEEESAAAAESATTTEAVTETQESSSIEPGETLIHKVKKGETLSQIAERYGTTTRAIARANDLTDASTIIPGQELKIQVSGDSSDESSDESSSGESTECRKQHKVKKGEWVWKIAAEYGVAPKEIMKANNLTSRKAKVLQPGTILCIP